MTNAFSAASVIDATTGHPLQGIASPDLAEAAAAEDGLVFASESCGVWTYVPADPRVLAVHRQLHRDVRLVQVTSGAHGSAA